MALHFGSKKEINNLSLFF
uniref:Uncharacterized protein n=1 Tax=Rhizophora mucronata TaxID=61149 RepID=A0A2P2R0L7_RHIMU